MATVAWLTKSQQ